MTLCFIQRADSLVNFFSADGAAGFEPVGCGEFAAGGLLGGDEVAKEDVAVCEGLFDDEGVGGVVIEGVAEGGCLGGALGGVVIAGSLDNLAEFAVGAGEPWVCFLDMQLAQLDAEVGFSEAECCCRLDYRFHRGGNSTENSPLRHLTTLSTF